MDPKILPMIEQCCASGPVARFQARHVTSSGESVVDTVTPDGLSPEQIAVRLWESVEGDALMHDGAAVYWIVAYRNEGDATPMRRVGVKRNVDKLGTRLADNPLVRVLDTQAKQLTDRDSALMGMAALIVKQSTEDKDRLLRMVERGDRRIEAMQDRELDVVRLVGELMDKKEQRKLEQEESIRRAKLFGKIEDMGLLLLGEAMGSKDGKLAPVVERQIMQQFVDELSDEDIAGMLETGTLKLPANDRRTQLLRMLQPYLEESLRKKQAKMAEDAASAAVHAAMGAPPPVAASANGASHPSPGARDDASVITTTGESIQ